MFNLNDGKIRSNQWEWRSSVNNSCKPAKHQPWHRFTTSNLKHKKFQFSIPDVIACKFILDLWCLKNYIYYTCIHSHGSVKEATKQERLIRHKGERNWGPRMKAGLESASFLRGFIDPGKLQYLFCQIHKERETEIKACLE